MLLFTFGVGCRCLHFGDVYHCCPKGEEEKKVLLYQPCLVYIFLKGGEKFRVP